MDRPLYFASSIRDALWRLPAGVPSSERLVLMLLMLYAQPNGLADVGRAELARMSGLSERSVKRLMQSLRERGLLGAPVALGRGKGYQHPLLVRGVQEEPSDAAWLSVVMVRPTPSA